MSIANIDDDKTIQKIWDRIDKAGQILLHCHPNTDGDSVGSALAMQHVLKKLGKKATVIAGDNPVMPDFLSFLPGFSGIEQKDFFQVDLKAFDLFIILDSSTPGQISRKQPIVFPLSIPSIVIDHHISNEGFADINLIEPTYPATAQILYTLFKRRNIPLEHDSALCLFTGLYTDTGGFQFKGTSADTFRAAGDLVALAPDFTDALFAMHNNETPGSIAFMALVFNNIKKYFGGKVIISSISHAELQERGIQRDDINSMVANMLKSVVGWDVCIICSEELPGQIKVSFRTRDSKRFDLSKISAVLGGGGHPAAAGASLKSSLSDAVAKIQTTLEATYPELSRK